LATTTTRSFTIASNAVVAATPLAGQKAGRTMLKRLGDVVYWLGCIAAGITLLAGGYEAAWGAFDSRWYFLIVVVVAAVVWLLGSIFRHVITRI
jgi:hypothetical protein